MKRVHPGPFAVARRGLHREINREIVLNLVRARQPLSRADVARLMGTRRGAVSLIVNDLIAEGLLFEGATGETPRGRKPKFLYIDSRRRCVLAVDIRATGTSLMVTDLLGQPVMARAQWHKKQSWRSASPNADREKALNWRLSKETSCSVQL